MTINWEMGTNLFGGPRDGEECLNFIHKYLERSGLDPKYLETCFLLKKRLLT